MYIHQSTCISPQHTFIDALAHDNALHTVIPSKENKLIAVEPKYEGIPLSILRRMGKAVRMGVGSALPLLQSVKPDGIIMGTANGGMEDCIKFLNQVMHYNEGTLTPTNFVQSTPNSVAAQIGLITNNTGYNATHVHRGLAFENAMIDVLMLLNENKNACYLLGGLDEISDYNFAIEKLGNWYKNEDASNNKLYEISSAGTIAGEGAAMFICNNASTGASAKVVAVKTLHTNNIEEVKQAFQMFIDIHLNEKNYPDVFLSGENGDNRLFPYYAACGGLLPGNTMGARYKHYCGEYPTASAFALWLGSQFLLNQQVPGHFIEKAHVPITSINTILLYNTYKGVQHSFMLIEKVPLEKS